MGLALTTALWLWVWAFLDDLLIASANFDELLEHLDFVLYRLRAYGFKLKPSKVVLAKKEVPMLGFILNGSKIFNDPHKRESLRLWAKPALKKESFIYAIRQLPPQGHPRLQQSKSTAIRNLQQRRIL